MLYRWCRGLVVLAFAVVVFGGAAVALWFGRHYTDSETVRRLVLRTIRDRLPGALVEIGSTRVRLLGGVTLYKMSIRHDAAPDREVINYEELTICPEPKALVDGRLVVRSASVARPTLHLHRSAKGEWNLARWIHGPARTIEEVAAITVRDGRVLITSDDPAWPAMELTKVEADLQTAPPDSVSFRLTARHPSAQLVQLAGEARLRQPGLRIDKLRVVGGDVAGLWALLPPPLRQRLPPQTKVAGRIDATAQGDAALVDGTWRWDGNLNGSLRDGVAEHPELPDAVREAHADFVCGRDHLRVTAASFRLGPATCSMSGVLPKWQKNDAVIDLHVVGLPLDEAVRERLGERQQRLWNLLQPSGVVDVVGRFELAKARQPFVGQVTLRENRATFQKFPIPISGVTGTVVFEDGGRITWDAEGSAGAATGRCTGDFADASPTSEATVSLKISQLPIDDRCRAALAVLSPTSSSVIDHLQGVGMANGSLVFRRPATNSEFQFEGTVALATDRFAADWFPYPLREVRGTLNLRPDRTDLLSFTGRGAGNARVTMNGWIQRDHAAAGAAREANAENGTHWRLDLTADDVPLDEHVRAALPKRWQPAYDSVHPYGAVSLWARLDKPADAELGMAFSFDLSQASILPEAFAYRLHGFEGTVHLTNGVVWWNELFARHGSTLWKSGPARIHSTPEGGTVAFALLESPATPFDADLRRAVPPGVRSVLEWIAPDKPVGLRLKDFRIHWFNDGQPAALDLEEGIAEFQRTSLLPSVGLANVTGKMVLSGVCRDERPELTGNLAVKSITAAGMTATDLTGRMKIIDSTVEFENLRGQFYGGHINFPLLRAATAPAPAYECRLKVMGASLNQFVRENWGGPAPVDGLVSGELMFSARGAQIKRLNGAGNLDMQQVDIRKFPPVIDVLDFLFVKMPEGQLFDKARAQFRLEPGVVQVDQLELSTPAMKFGLREKGMVRLDTGELNLQMSGGRVHIPLLSDTMAFRIHGTLSAPKVTPAQLRGLRNVFRRPPPPPRKTESRDRSRGPQE